jgi:hypothetical protein
VIFSCSTGRLATAPSQRFESRKQVKPTRARMRRRVTG